MRTPGLQGYHLDCYDGQGPRSLAPPKAYLQSHAETEPTFYHHH
jgi:hypothetical protein